MTPSKIFLYFCLSFVGGIFISSILGFLPGSRVYLLLPGLISGLILISVLWRYKKVVVFGFCILFLVFGIWRHQQTEIQISKSKLQIFKDIEEKVVLVGIVLTEPDIKEKTIKLTIETENINEIPMKGKVLITTNRYPEYQYGDKLKIIGKLKIPQDFEGFNYKNYLAKDGVYSVMDWPKIERIGENFGNPVMKILFSFKNKFKESARQFISPPQGGILEALFFGDEENISNEWKDKFNFTGTRHITAVSGMNITIIASLILSFALGLGLWRQQAFYLSIFFLLLYILMIGAPASAVRAGIMGGFFLLAQRLGRMSKATRAVVFASTFMLFLNPLLLRLDVGFQLSFLAILGIIYLQPTITNWFKKIPNPKIFPLKTTLSTTIAAQVFTLPILIYNFGYIPFVSPITNILIVPLLAPITILIFVFGLSGMIFWGFGWVLSWPTWLSLTYITKIIDSFSQIPFASLTFKIHWVFLIISYLILGFTVWRLQERQKLKFLEY